MYVRLLSRQWRGEKLLREARWLTDAEFVVYFQAPEDLRDAFPTGKGFRLSHNGTQDMIFYAETETNAEKWIAAILDAVAFK